MSALTHKPTSDGPDTGGSMGRGRTIRQVADDLGVGMSSLSTWKRKLDRAELMAGPHEDVTKELARLRRENGLLRAERDLLKKATAFFASKAKPSSTA